MMDRKFKVASQAGNLATIPNCKGENPLRCNGFFAWIIKWHYSYAMVLMAVRYILDEPANFYSASAFSRHEEAMT